MGTSVIGTLSAEQMQQEAAKQQLMADAANAPSTQRKFQFFAAFDGTNNDKDNVPLSGSPYPTNAANLFSQAETASKGGASNLIVGYYPGVGTGGEMGGLLSAGLFPSNAVEAAAQKAYRDFVYEATQYLSNTPDASMVDIGVAAVGVSRGAPTAVRFAQLLNDKGLQDATGKQWAPPGSIPVDALAVIEPVATFVDQNGGIPPNVQDVLQITARKENRSDFRGLDYSLDSRVTQVEVDANHMGAGGGQDRNGTGANVLEGVTAYFQRSGYGLAPVPPEHTFDMSSNAKLYTEIYQTAANGDVLVHEDGTPRLVWRVDAGDTRQTIVVEPPAAAPPATTQYIPEQDSSQPFLCTPADLDTSTGSSGSSGTGLKLSGSGYGVQLPADWLGAQLDAAAQGAQAVMAAHGGPLSGTQLLPFMGMGLSDVLPSQDGHSLHTSTAGLAEVSQQANLAVASAAASNTATPTAPDHNALVPSPVAPVLSPGLGSAAAKPSDATALLADNMHAPYREVDLAPAPICLPPASEAAPPLLWTLGLDPALLNTQADILVSSLTGAPAWPAVSVLPAQTSVLISAPTSLYTPAVLAASVL